MLGHLQAQWWPDPYIRPDSMNGCLSMELCLSLKSVLPVEIQRKILKPRILSFDSYMMTSSNGKIFRVTGHLCGEFNGPRWIPLHKGQWRGALMFSLICAWINGRVNNREAGDLRRHRAHYDVSVMDNSCIIGAKYVNHQILYQRLTTMAGAKWLPECP